MASRAPELRPGMVTRVAAQEKDADRVNVFIDGEFGFGLALEIAVDAALAPGVELSLERQEELIALDQVARAKTAALGYLGAQARTSAELRRTLLRRGFEPEVADRVIDWARERRYVDDAEYARSYVRARFAGRGHGPARLRQELARRGIQRDLIDAALDEMLAEADVGEAATDVARPRWRALAGEPDPRRRRQKTLDFLVRRGFDYDDAREAVVRVAREEGEDSDMDGAA